MNFTDLLDECGVAHHTSGKDTRPGWVQMTCPLCGGGKYLGFNTRGNYFHCWRCHKLPLFSTLSEVTGQSEAQCRRLFATLSKEEVEEVRLTGRLVLPNGVGPLLSIHRHYLKARGFDPDLLTKIWGVQGIGLAAKLAWRLFLPITYLGKTVSWTTRSLGGESRYISAGAGEESLPHHHLLYGEDFARHACCVVEGPFDAMRIGPGAVATFGTGYSQAQVLRIARFPLRVICLDAEEEAQRSARKLCEDLKALEGRTINIVLDSKDPGSASNQEVRRLRKFLE